MSESNPLSRTAWIVVLSAASLVFSIALACAMPFAALGAVAALALPRRDAFAAAGIGWLANQAVGYGILGYPTDPITLAWGVALGLSALAAVAAALGVLKAKVSFAIRAVLGLIAALVAQQAVVWAASWPLNSHPSAFALPVLLQIAWTNALAYAALAGLQWIGGRAGLTSGLRRQAAG